MDHWNLLYAECPVDVKRDCPGRCNKHRHPGAAMTCRWEEFPCDFKVCWGDCHNRVHIHSAGDELLRAIANPRLYQPASAEQLPAGLRAYSNLIAEIRLTVLKETMIILDHGNFIVYMPAFSSRQQAQKILENSRQLIEAAWRWNENSHFISKHMDSSILYRLLGCKNNNCSFVLWQNMKPPPELGQDPAVLQKWIFGLDWADLITLLHTNMPAGVNVEFNEDILRVNGVALFSPETDREELYKVYNLFTPEQAAAAIRAQQLLINWRVDQERDLYGPPPEGMIYHFDMTTGEVEEIPAPWLR